MSIPVYCKGCVYRSNSKGDCNTCDYMFATGKPRGCPAGPGCTKYTPLGENRPAKSKPPKRVLLTEEEKRQHRNAIRRKSYAKKKAAALLEQDNGAIEK